MKINKELLKVYIKVILLIGGLGFLFVIVFPYIFYNTIIKNENEIKNIECINKKDTISIQDSVYSYIFKLRLEHPKIVMAQCIEESGHFKSKLFLEGNNLIGMKVPSIRPTLAKSVLYSHAKFNSWKECLADYAIWQQIYVRNKSENEYFEYLDKVYAEKKGYSDRLKEIIKRYNL